MGQGAKVTKFSLSPRTCKHTAPKIHKLPGLAHPLGGHVYAIQICGTCGASRIAEYDVDPDGEPFNMVAVFQWRSSV